jgi:hypothetical protein
MAEFKLSKKLLLTFEREVFRENVGALKVFSRILLIPLKWIVID